MGWSWLRDFRRGGFSVVVSSVSKIEIIAGSDEFITTNLVHKRLVQNYFSGPRGAVLSYKGKQKAAPGGPTKVCKGGFVEVLRLFCSTLRRRRGSISCGGETWQRVT